jgi:hypothetical protein
MTAVKAVMRDFANTSIRYNKEMRDTDKLTVGIRPVDHNRSPKPNPTDLVEAEISTVPTDHRVVVAFHIAGSKSRGKGPYHAAEIRYWVRPLSDPAPLDANEEGWHSVADTASPWEHSFPGADAGKRLYIVMRWENEATGEGEEGKGPWSEIMSVIIP